MTHFLYILDMIIPILAIFGWQIAYSRGQIERWLYLSYGWGVLVGCLWEIPIGLLGNNFNKILDDNPLGFWIHISHALLDSFILLLGLWCVGAAKREKLVEQGTPKRTLMIFTFLELIQAVTVELLFNGHFWKYSTTVHWNPVVFWIHRIGYTLWPFLVWAIAPTFFYKGVQMIAIRNPPKLPGIPSLWSEPDAVRLQVDDETTTSYRQDIYTTDPN